MKKRNKKGSHAGFAIAFVLFVGFVIFLFSILGPVGKVKSDKDFLLKHLEDKIIKNVSGELTIISVKPPSPGECNFSLSSDLHNYFTKEVDGLIKIYNSSEPFNSRMINCGAGLDEIGLIRTDKYVFETKIFELMTYYNTSYKPLKDYFGIPEINGFEFGFEYNNGTEIKVTNLEEIPSTDVFAKIIPVTYVDQSANINVGYMRIVLW